MRPTLLLAGLVSMLPAAVGQEGGGVWATVEVSGIVHDELGRPLADVAVAWFPDRAWTADQLDAATVTRTDVDGCYTCRVGAGRVPTGWQADRSPLLPRLVFARRGRATMAAPVAGSHPLTLDVCMLPGASLRARVVDARGEPAVGLRVRAELARPGFITAEALPTTAARTGDDGIVVLDNVPAAGVEAVVDEPGWAVRRSLPTVVGATVTLRTERTGFLRGRVVQGSGQPLAVVVETIDQGGVRRIARAGADGWFSLPRSTNSRHFLSAFDEWGGVLALRGGRVAIDGPQDALELVAAGEPVAPLGVRVVDRASGLVIPGIGVAWVRGRPWQVDQRLAQGLYETERLFASRTDTAGEIEVHAPRGSLDNGSTLVCGKEGKGWWFVAVPRDRDGGPVEIALGEPVTLRGHLVEGDAPGVPLAGVPVFASPLSETVLPGANPQRALWRATTDQDGAFTIPDLRPGEWRIHVWATDRPAVEPIVIEIPAERIEPVRLELPRAVSLRGRVTRRRDLPASSRIVVQPPASIPEELWWLGVSHQPRSTGVRLAGDGTFLARGLVPGLHEVSLLLPRAHSSGGGFPPTVLLGLLEVSSDVDRITFEGASAVPVQISGAVSFRGADVPPGRFGILARPIRRYSVGPDVPDASSDQLGVLDKAGEFRFRVPGGRWQLGVIDLLSGQVVACSERLDLVAADESAPLTLRIEIGAVRLRAGAGRGSLLGIEGGPPPAGEAPVLGDDFGVVEHHVVLGERLEPLIFYLPPVPHRFQLWGDSAALPPADFMRAVFADRLPPDATANTVPVPGKVLDLELNLPERR